MPTYAYACTECDHRFEAQQAFTDASLTECPECAGRLRKLFNAVGIVFKGSGFYRTDSRGKNGSTGSGTVGSSSESASSSSSGSSSSGTNGAAKTDASKSSSSGSSSSTPAASGAKTSAA